MTQNYEYILRYPNILYCESLQRPRQHFLSSIYVVRQSCLYNKLILNGKAVKEAISNKLSMLDFINLLSLIKIVSIIIFSIIDANRYKYTIL